jgi:hypothetical protein
MQLETVAHETAPRYPPAGGVSDSVQVVPSQSQAFAPTAMQNVLLGHETPESAAPGVATTDQLTPSQRSTNTFAPALRSVVYSPTAIQLVLLAHETA